MLFNTLLAVAAVVGPVAASPVEAPANTVVLPLSLSSNATSLKSIVDRGLQRIAAINGVSNVGPNPDLDSGSITNEDVSYVAPVKIGGKTFQLIVDTGSSNTWCGARGKCEPSGTGKSTGNSVSVDYGSGEFSGTEYTDTVSFGSATVKSQSIGSAKSSTGFTTIDGIIGFGPVDLTEQTVANTNTVPTFMDNLYKQGSISTEVLGVYFKPESGSDDNDANGELTLGGTDSSKYTGSITYFPKLTSSIASHYWGIKVASFTYGTKTLASNANGIVDTGTTLVYIPTTAFNAFLSATGGKIDSNSGLAVFTKKPTSNFGIKFGSTTFTLTPEQYLVPTAQYAFYGLSSGKYYAWINDGGSSGVNTIIGQKFLENYYSVFDTTKARIGFAPRT